jgi:hypothetical protein
MAHALHRSSVDLPGRMESYAALGLSRYPDEEVLRLYLQFARAHGAPVGELTIFSNVSHIDGDARGEWPSSAE